MSEPEPIVVNINITIRLGEPHPTGEHTDDQILREQTAIRNTDLTWNAEQDENGDWVYTQTDGQGAREAFSLSMERAFDSWHFQQMILFDKLDVHENRMLAIDHFVI